MFRDMLNDWVGRSLLILFGIFILFIPFIIMASIDENKRWNAFAASHDCQIVGRMPGNTYVTYIQIGQTSIPQFNTTPDKIAYKCNDGVTYWR